MENLGLVQLGMESVRDERRREELCRTLMSQGSAFIPVADAGISVSEELLDVRQRVEMLSELQRRMSMSTFQELTPLSYALLGEKVQEIARRRLYEELYRLHGFGYGGRATPEMQGGMMDMYGRAEEGYGRAEERYGRAEEGYGRAEERYGRAEEGYGRGEMNEMQETNEGTDVRGTKRARSSVSGGVEVKTPRSEDEDGTPSRSRRCKTNRRKSCAYVGVRKRKWGTFASEVRNHHTGSREWLGTYSTSEEAALIYDQRLRQIKGEKAKCNFPELDMNGPIVRYQVCPYGKGSDERIILSIPTNWKAQLAAMGYLAV